MSTSKNRPSNYLRHVRRLASRQALLLVDDYDSKALFYQFQAESPGQVTWDELGTSPNAWRGRIGKIGTARECGAG